MSKLVVYSFVCVSVFIVLAIANLLIPQCQITRSTETALNTVSFGAIFILLAPLMFFLHFKGAEAKRYVPLFFLLFFSSAPNFWSTMARSAETKRQYWNFDGVVTKKYVSNNHAAKSLSIGHQQYEFIPLDIWKIVQVGDTINKQACNNIIAINGQPFNFRDN